VLLEETMVAESMRLIREYGVDPQHGCYAQAILPPRVFARECVNDALSSARLDAQKRTCEAKVPRVEGYLVKATELRIRRMREAQLRNLKARYETEKTELEKRREVRTTSALRLAGVMLLEPRSAAAEGKERALGALST